MRSLYLLLLALLIATNARAQLTVSNAAPYNSAQYLVEHVLFNGNTTVTNVQYTGANNAKGFFNAINTNLGIGSGVLLTTGLIQNATGLNLNSSSGTYNALSGDSMLTAISGMPTFDACVLQFDFIASSNLLSFRYVFGSEEYPEFVNLSGGGVNDVVGFFLSGPNPSGGNYQNLNLATVPGTNSPVSINTVNCQSFSAFYVCNDPYNNLATQCPPAYSCPTSASQTTLQYDGFTTPLTAEAPLIYGQTYTLRISIADGGDGILDSGVFFEEGSFSNFFLNTPSSVCINSSPFLLTGGSPTGGSYYINGSMSTVFNPASVGLGSHTIAYVFPFPGGVFDTVANQIVVHPAVHFTMNPIPVLCTTSGNYLLNISPVNGIWMGPGLVLGTAFNPSLAGVGSHSLNYSYTSSAGCTVDTTIIITVSENPSQPIVVQLGNLLTCNLNGMNYQWMDAQGNPILGATSQSFNPPWAGTYSVMVTNAYGCSAQSLPYSVLSIKEGSIDFGWELFPNPSQGEFVVRFESQGTISGHLTVEDAAGRVVYQQAITEHSGLYEQKINLENAQSGVYNVSIHYNGRSMTKRVVVQK